MTSQKYTGRKQLVARLGDQVGSKELAINILKKRGDLKADGKTLTAKGAKRDNMTAGERAIDRAKKESSHKASDYKYIKKINRAVLR
jgi:hypothetical protein